MIDLSTIRFKEERNEHFPHITNVVGSHVLTSSIKVNVFPSEGAREYLLALAREEIRKCIWHRVYGDLSTPIAELSNYCLVNVKPVELFRVDQLCKELEALLSYAKGKDQAS